MSKHLSTCTLLSVAAFAVGCYQESDLGYADLTGTVRIPVAAASFDVVKEVDGVAQRVTIEPDARGLGPVYLGLYSAINDVEYGYPHPEVGPVLDRDIGGDAYPYGGTTVGRFDYACYEMLNCRVVTGRYDSFDDVLDWFGETIGEPVINHYGDEVLSATEFRERCYELMFLTSDSELPFVAEPPSFVKKGDYFEADVDILHSQYVDGVSVWGWIDRPSAAFGFDTCSDDESLSWQMFYYDEQYFTGSHPLDLLNFPNKNIQPGDWLVEDPAIITNPEKNFEVEISYVYE